jgi:probable rRNA maturation factor
MILLDPDLEPDPAPKTNLVTRVGALAQTRNSKTNSRDVRLPSARGLARFLAAAQAAVRLKGQVTVLLTTDAAIRKLNRQFRGKNKATDVLSFPAAGVGAAGMAGDLAISVTTAMGQAAEQGHSLGVEIKVLVLHGLLHLAGFDHEADDGRMARREKALRARLGLPLGLIERGEIPSVAKAQIHSGRVNVRAEARTLHLTRAYAGAKARDLPSPISARLKSCPDTKWIFEGRYKQAARGTEGKHTSGAKAHVYSPPSMSGLKPGPTARASSSSGPKARVDSSSLIVGVKTPTYRHRSPAKAERL